ncbi:uncharacterized protein IL334_007374 [Kwoniella shivajii]|uniref:Isochorismatase-like domain-containing protein n=1 Tax=Kwoniella shivajii TaxID=564305 RepID=A0ABZ1D8H8_9TREE|nr:hypothetical protein IL334_007374 [Kwoniella shivajii]
MSSAQSLRQLLGEQASTASINDSTLIIIDAQNEYINGSLATTNIENTRKGVSTVLEKYRDGNNQHGGRNIIHVLHKTPEGAPIFTPNTPLFDEFDELKPVEGGNEKTILKGQPSSFAGTELEEYLKSLGDAGKKVVLTGYMAHVCVSTTARKADELGLEVIIVEDAVGDRDIPGVSGEDLTRVALAELGDAFGTIVDSKSIKVD